MIDFKSYIIKHFIKFKVSHSIPGRLRLKISNASKIPQEAKEYEEYVLEAIKLLDGVESVDFNYVTGSILVNYDPKKVYEEKIIKWINKAIEVILNDIKLIEQYGVSNIDYVIDTLEQKLNEKVQTI